MTKTELLRETADPRLERFRQAYLAMACEAGYRPQAPSDGFGHIRLNSPNCAIRIAFGLRRPNTRYDFPPRKIPTPSGLAAVTSKLTRRLFGRSKPLACSPVATEAARQR
jgi:hypothetical protein